MTPTTPIDPRQRIDQEWRAGVLVEETVHAWPPDGTAVRRWEDDAGVARAEVIHGLVVPEPTVDDRIAAAVSVLAEAEADGPILVAQLVADLRDALGGA